MGYTHYWKQSRDFTSSEWQQVQLGVRKIVDLCTNQGINLQYEYDDSKKPAINKKHVRFNGLGDAGHETFMIEKLVTYNPWEDKSKPHFNFCKTARKPYDLAVCLSLLRIKSVAPDCISLASDGYWDDEWNQAREVYSVLFDEDFSKAPDGMFIKGSQG